MVRTSAVRPPTLAAPPPW